MPNARLKDNLSRVGLEITSSVGQIEAAEAVTQSRIDELGE
ncbi:MAG: hypothetical protein PVJ28_04395 [Acidimicrobiia bacterium]